MSRLQLRLRALAVVTAGVAVCALTACTAAPVAPPVPSPTEQAITPTGDGVLRIGTLFPTTGATAFIAAAQVAGVNAAVREINAAGGVVGQPVEVLSRDSGDATTQTAEASFADLVARGVDVIIGPSSSALAERLLPLAAEAGIPLVSPAATYPRLDAVDTDGWIFRTIPSYAHQGTVLGSYLPGTGAAKVALVATGDEVASSIAEPLEASLTANDAELVASVTVDAADAIAAAVADVLAAAPDAVVLATPDNGDLTKALVQALGAAGLGGAKLWLTSQNLADYSQALPAGTLTGVNGILQGTAVDQSFVDKLKVEDPGLVDTRYAAEAFDAVMVAALAAVAAEDDGGASIAALLPGVTQGGIRCASFGECVDVLSNDHNIAYEGITGPLRLDAAGSPTRAVYSVVAYDAENRYAVTGTAAG